MFFDELSIYGILIIDYMTIFVIEGNINLFALNYDAVLWDNYEGDYKEH